ncbi:MAG: FtsX-like permease family protein [Cyclobacteriaceae bacterium]
MLYNYLLITFRNFYRHKSSFFINLFGLSTGLASTILILLWVIDEFSIDQFHAESESIYSVMENQTYEDGKFSTHSTPGILSTALKAELPEIELAATSTWSVEAQLTYDEQRLKAEGRFVDPDFLRIFTYPALHGDIENALDNPTSIVISEEMAIKLFDRTDVVGESVDYLSENKRSYQITAVLLDAPERSSFKFDFLISFDVFRADNDWVNEWGNNGPRTHIKTIAGVEEAALEHKIKHFIVQRNESSNVELFLHPYADTYLFGRYENGVQSGGRITYVKIFLAIAGFILVIACINFMNLSTARSARRAKEVGIRKTLGANRKVLIGQFIGESVLITFLSLLIGLILVMVFLPQFNVITEKQISLDFTDWRYWAVMVTVVSITGILAGSYPALYLSSFEPGKVLKGRVRLTGGEAFIRKGLVVFQYTLSVGLIIATMVIYLQLDFIQNQNLGYQQENIVYFNIEGDLIHNYEGFANALRQLPEIEEVSASSHTFMGRNSNSSGIDWPGKNPESLILFEMVASDNDLRDVMGFEVVDGRFFSREFADDSTRLVINERAAKVMGLENPVGTSVKYWGEIDAQIVGVVKDFQYQSVRSEIAPMIMRYQPVHASVCMVKVNSGDIQSTMEKVGAQFNRFNPNYVFDYRFLDDEYDKLYTSEVRVGSLSGYFSLFAIAISCLGLFGLSSFTAERRTKEIGIRKALGASAASIVYLLTKDFTKLVSLSVLISVPLAWYAMKLWLDGYEYRIDLGWWIFLVGSIISLIVAWITISFQSVRAANANPALSLHVED